MLLRMLCFLEWCFIIMINMGSSLSITCFSEAGIYFSVFAVCLSLSCLVTDEPCQREKHLVCNHWR